MRRTMVGETFPPGQYQVINNVDIGDQVMIWHHVNLYDCEIGDDTMIGSFVEIQGAKIGPRNRIQSHSFIPEGVTTGADVFIGHGVMFSNDRYPLVPSVREGDWKLEPTVVEAGASIGNGATILPGLTIGRGAMVGAGAVVISDIPPGVTFVGNPARPIKKQA